MDNIQTTKRTKIMNAFYLGFLCAVAYLSVYFARNVLGTVTPQMITGGYSEEYLGTVSSAYFGFYAVGQIFNGIIGDKIKGKYMISIGLLSSAIANIVFLKALPVSPSAAVLVYGIMGLCMSMIYAPMTKMIAENTDPIYATWCSLSCNIASFLGSPLAGVAASVFVWSDVFGISGIYLAAMAVIFFLFCTVFEKKSILKYGQFKQQKTSHGGSAKTLVRRGIIKFVLLAMVTGPVRTSVVFWIPTYISQHLGFSSAEATSIFALATIGISATAFVTVFVYEALKRNMNLTVFLFFISAAISFSLTFLIKQPALNIIFIVLAIISSNCADTMMWSRYCPSLYDTGMVSTATGFLGFVSYLATAVANIVFARAITSIGWSKLILVWCAMMVFGIIVAIPRKRAESDAAQ